MTVQRSELPFLRVRVPPTEGDPATVVVISSGGEGDRSVESLEVKVPEGWGVPVRSVRGGKQLGRHHDPRFNFKGVRANKKLTIAPGPNNPVGLVWIDLTKA